MTEWQGFYTPAEVSRIARIPRGTLSAWKRKRILVPSVELLEDGKVVEVGYSYADLTILRLCRFLRDKKLNMRSVCAALQHLIDRFGHPDDGWPPNVKVYIEGKHVYADKPDNWQLTSADLGGQKIAQVVFGEVVDIDNISLNKGSIFLPPDFPDGLAQFISIHPGVMGGEPVIRHTRVPVSAIANKHRKGTSIERLVQLYSPITRVAIESALEYQRFLDSPISKTRTAAA